MKQNSLARERDGETRFTIRQRVLIADDDTHFARRLASFLWNHGCEARVVRTATEAREAVEFWQPQSVFVNIVLAGSPSHGLLRFIQNVKTTIKPRVAVMSSSSATQGLEFFKRAGARYSLLKPFPAEEALKVVEDASVQPPQPQPSKLDFQATSIRELYLMRLILKQATWSGPQSARLFNLMRMIGMKVKALRCSLIECDYSHTGFVRASNDDEKISGLPLELSVYPEIMEVKRTNRRLIIPNIRTSDLMATVQTKLAQAPFETIAIFPVYRGGVFYGVLSLRLEQRQPADIIYIEQFGEVCAQILTLALK